MTSMDVFILAQLFRFYPNATDITNTMTGGVALSQQEGDDWKRALIHLDELGLVRLSTSRNQVGIPDWAHITEAGVRVHLSRFGLVF